MTLKEVNFRPKDGISRCETCRQFRVNAKRQEVKWCLKLMEKWDYKPDHVCDLYDDK